MAMSRPNGAGGEGRASARPTRADYIRQAQRFGTDLVFETAAGSVWPFRPDLNIRELGRLSLSLQKIDPGWRLPPAEKAGFEVRGLDGADFALMLIAERVDADRAARMAMVSRRTIQRRQRRARELLREAADEQNQGSEPAFASGKPATNGTGRVDRSSWADLSQEAQR
jgi:hypothetical protein